MGHARNAAAQRKQEQILQNACNILSSQQSLPSKDQLSIRKVAKKFGVNHCTLRNHFIGAHKACREAHESQQNLSNVQETILTAWIKNFSNSSEPIPKRGLRRKIFEITGGRVTPGKNWMARFILQNPDIRLGKPSGLDPKRAQSFNKTEVTGHFETLKKAIDECGFPPENIWNMDEKGCQRGGGRKLSSEKYFIPRSKRPAYRRKSDNLELVTIIECASAVGTSLPPGFVFPAKQFHHDWLMADPNTFVSVSDNGWIDDFLGTQWFKNVFIPEAQKQNTSGKPILIIFDGHSSHITQEIHDSAMENDVHIIYLPPHTTHCLQPLDVGIFGPLDRAFAKRCDDVLMATKEEIPIQDFVLEYVEVRKKAFTPEIIKKAFEKCGIYPFNDGLFTESDFAPSNPTSTMAHFPDSYPQSSSFQQACSPRVQEEHDMANDRDSDGDSDMDDTDKEPEEDECQSQMATPDHMPKMVQDPEIPHANSSQHFESPSLDSIALLPAPILSTFHLQRTQSSTSMPNPYENLTVEQQLKIALERIDTQGKQISVLQKQVEETQTHCAMAMGVVSDLKVKLNGKAKTKRKSVTMALDSRWVTSGEGLISWNKLRAEKEEALKQKNVARQRREEEAQRKQQERVARGPVERFQGSLKSKVKDDLLELISALSISLPSPTTKRGHLKKNLIELIENHFENHPELKANTRFAGLFPQPNHLGNDEEGAAEQPVANEDNQVRRPPLSAATGPSTSSLSCPVGYPIPRPTNVYTPSYIDYSPNFLNNPYYRSY